VYYVGVDIGSTASKAAVFEGGELRHTVLTPTGWSAVEAANSVSEWLERQGIPKERAVCVATGYGRLSVAYAAKALTEITCHGRGAYYLFCRDAALSGADGGDGADGWSGADGEDGAGGAGGGDGADGGYMTVLDIGGQDTKVMETRRGKVLRFVMNDKCSAGTGRFLDVMANTLGVAPDQLSDMARRGGGVTISSMCTVFAESEVVNLIGSGRRREDIAHGVVASVADKVGQLCGKLPGARYFLTGGLCENAHLLTCLERVLGKPVVRSPLGRYAGAVGAALIGRELFGEEG
jgi:activator of 2-hydroxyglutaryl-CoA dehydratase